MFHDLLEIYFLVWFVKNFSSILNLKFFLFLGGILVEDLFKVYLILTYIPTFETKLFLHIDVDIKWSLYEFKNALVMALEIEIYLHTKKKSQ
jgi:hypothetical protein